MESQRSELERLDQQVGRKRTELQLLQESQERRQGELNSLLRQAEAELSAKQREIKVWFALVYFGGVMLGYDVMVKKGGKENSTVQAKLKYGLY